MIKSAIVQERIQFRRFMKPLRESEKGTDRAFMNFVMRRYVKFEALSVVGRHKQLAKLIRRKEIKVEWVFDD